MLPRLAAYLTVLVSLYLGGAEPWAHLLVGGILALDVVISSFVGKYEGPTPKGRSRAPMRGNRAERRARGRRG